MQKRVDEVLDHFDFEKVHKAMEALDWHWLSSTNGVPTIPELRQNARELLWDAVENSCAGTGGFTAIYNEYGDLILRFCIDEFESVEGNEDEPVF